MSNILNRQFSNEDLVLDKFIDGVIEYFIEDVYSLKESNDSNYDALAIFQETVITISKKTNASFNHFAVHQPPLSVDENFMRLAA